MRTTLAALAVTLCSAGSVMAVEYRTPATKQLYTCAAAGLSRVAVAAMPEPCCYGRLRCAQFLSKGGVLKPMLDPRT